MRTALALLLLSAIAASAQQPAARPVAVQPAPIPQQMGLINLNVIDALIAIDAKDLAGVFSFVPEQVAPAAFADYLLRNKTAFKRFLKKSEADLKVAGGVSEWDQMTYRYLVTLYGSGVIDLHSVPKRYVDRAMKLSIAPALPLEAIKMKRKD